MIRHATSLSLRATSTAAVLVSGLLTMLFLSGPPAHTVDARPDRASATDARPAGSAPDPALAPCRMKPNNGNTGASGTLRPSSRTVLGDGARLKNAHVSELMITGTDVRVENVRVDGALDILGENVRLKRVTAPGVGITGATDVVVARANIGYSTQDSIHINSDGDRYTRDVVLRYNYIHHPVNTPESHYDATQVRDIDTLVIRCSTYQMGPYDEAYNANIYLENTVHGVSNATVARNWLYGSLFGVMVSADSARLIGNKFGGDIHYGYCYLSSEVGDVVTRDNIKVPEGRKINLCGLGK